MSIRKFTETSAQLLNINMETGYLAFILIFLVRRIKKKYKKAKDLNQDLLEEIIRT